MSRIALAATLVLATGCLARDDGPADAKIKALRRALESRDPNVSLQAASELMLLGEPGLEPLLDALGRGGLTARAHAAGVISSIGLDDPALRAKVEVAAVPALACLVDDPDASVRCNAVGSLGRFGPGAIEPLARALPDPDLGRDAAPPEAIARHGESGLVALREGAGVRPTARRPAAPRRGG
jgi:HEAT repeat protein